MVNLYRYPSVVRLREYLSSETTSEDGLDEVVNGTMQAEKIFKAADKDGSGYLELPELAQLVKQMLPGVNSEELKFLVTHLVFMDPDGDGRISLKELKAAVAQ
jgi:Ca2+-binding EF-hand superfamily protein